MNTLGSGQVSARIETFPCILTFSDIRLYIFAGVLVAVDVVVPWACHRVHPLAGPVFLPMFFFSLLAGLLFGWQVGLLVGFLTPLVSYATSGMPVLQRLPQVVVQNSVFGTAVGLLQQRFRLGTVQALLGALASGYLALGLAITAVYWGTVSPLMAVWQTIQQGWPGIAVQLALLPLVVKGLNNWFSRRNRGSAQNARN